MKFVPQRRFRLAWVPALLMLGLLASLNFAQEQRALVAAEGFTKAVNAAGYQRKLIQEAARHAANIATTRNPERVQVFRNALAGALGEMASTREMLIGNQPGLPDRVTGTVASMLRADDGALTGDLDAFVADMRRFGDPATRAEAVAGFDQLRVDEQTRQMASRVNDFVSQLEAAGNNHTVRIRGWELGYLAGMIATLIGIGLFLFLPMERKIRSEQRALEQANESLEARVRERTHVAEDRAQALAQSEAQYRAILDTALDAIITIDESGIIQMFNPAASRIFGYSEEEAIGQHINITMPDPYRSGEYSIVQRFTETGEMPEMPPGKALIAERKSGVQFPIELSLSEQKFEDKRFITGVVRDISERKNVERMKNEFISMVSHELRTPLTSIRGSLGLIAGGAAGELSDKGRHLVDIAATNCERLVRLINEILDIEKIESGKIIFNFMRAPVMTVVRGAVDANESLARKDDVTIRITDSVEEDIYAMVDTDRVRQVLDNLLSNATKFSPRGAEIEVAAAPRGNNVRISVADRGPGIGEEFRDRVFSRFSQADSSDSRNRGGSGLGLSISKAIVEKHGGVIAFENREEGGAVFYFELPIVEVVSLEELTGEDTTDPTVLIIEDDPDVARLLTLMLNEVGITTAVAANAGEAKRLLDRYDFKAATLDVMLPDQDGISLLQELRNSRKTKGLPIVVVSVVADRTRGELNGNALGVIDWLSKPIDQHRLIASVNRAIGNGVGHRPCILHVEDDVDILAIVGQILSDVAEVQFARTLRDARRALAERDFDMILLDVLLPDGSGLELVEALNQREMPTPVVIFSASDVEPEMARSVEAALVKSRTSNEALTERIVSIIGSERGVSDAVK